LQSPYSKLKRGKVATQIGLRILGRKMKRSRDAPAEAAVSSEIR